MAVPDVEEVLVVLSILVFFFFFQAEDGIRDLTVTGVQTCALPICGCSKNSRGFWRSGYSNTQRRGVCPGGNRRDFAGGIRASVSGEFACAPFPDTGAFGVFASAPGTGGIHQFEHRPRGASGTEPVCCHEGWA